MVDPESCGDAIKSLMNDAYQKQLDNTTGIPVTKKKVNDEQMDDVHTLLCNGVTLSPADCKKLAILAAHGRECEMEQVFILSADKGNFMHKKSKLIPAGSTDHSSLLGKAIKSKASDHEGDAPFFSSISDILEYVAATDGYFLVNSYFSAAFPTFLSMLPQQTAIFLSTLRSRSSLCSN